MPLEHVREVRSVGGPSCPAQLHQMVQVLRTSLGLRETEPFLHFGLHLEIEKYKIIIIIKDLLVL